MHVTDANGCAAQSNYVVEQPALLTEALVATAVSCYGGNDGTVAGYCLPAEHLHTSICGMTLAMTLHGRDYLQADMPLCLPTRTTAVHSIRR